MMEERFKCCHLHVSMLQKERWKELLTCLAVAAEQHLATSAFVVMLLEKRRRQIQSAYSFDQSFWIAVSQGLAGRWVLCLHLISLPQPGRTEDHKNTGSLTGTTLYMCAALEGLRGSQIAW